MAKIIGVKFRNTAKVYYFAPANDSDVYPEKAGVIVETAKGLEYGTVVFGVKEVDDSELTHPLKPVVRLATEKDEKSIRENEKKLPKAMEVAGEKIIAHGLDMKLVSCEFSFDGKKLVFYFTADGRIDFRELVKDLASYFHVRIELRQVGIRDEAKLLGGIAPCGRTCCCASCMPEFGKVSIKMAKNQGLHLNPSKISGLCGRLMCCLGYEVDYYVEAGKQLPKVGAEVGTPEGKAIVASLNMLKMEVRVKIDDKNGGWIYKDYPASELRFKKPCQQCQNAQTQGDDEEDIAED